MPAPKAPPGTAVYGTVRRRVWAHPALTSHSLAVLTLDQLILAPLAGPPKPAVVEAVEAGGDLDALLGPLATVIDLRAVQKVRLDLLTNSLTLMAAGAGTVTVVFATPDEADACFTKVWRRAGDALQLVPYRKDPWDAARTPLLTLIGVVVGAGFLALMASVADDFAAARAAGAVSVVGPNGAGFETRLPMSPFELFFGWLNWKVVCGLGGVLAAASQVWLYRRLTKPPATLELARV